MGGLKAPMQLVSSGSNLRTEYFVQNIFGERANSTLTAANAFVKVESIRLKSFSLATVYRVRV